MIQRLALRRLEAADESKLSRPLLDLMADHRLDFHSTFRRLAYFRPSMAKPVEGSEGDNPALVQFVSSLLTLTPEPQMVDIFKATSDWKAWLKTYAARIESERAEWEGEGDFDAAREHAARAANPRFVLRQWVLEEVIKKVEEDADSGKRVLAKVLQVRSLFLDLRKCAKAHPRWHAIHLSLGARRTILHPMKNLTWRFARRGGIVAWAKRRCLASNVAAPLERGFKSKSRGTWRGVIIWTSFRPMIYFD